jgi:hypothetical protein
VPRWAYSLIAVASLLIGAAAVVRGTRGVQVIGDSDLTNFFLKSAAYILRGDPWHMYAVRDSVFTSYPNYNPPLSIFLMAPFLGLARTVGFAANYGEQITFVSLPFLLFVPLLGYLVLRAQRVLYPEMPETQRLLAFVLVVLSPLTWQSIATWYHLEQPMMLCLLVAALIAFQSRREGLAGALAGLAVLTRTTALIPLIALGVLLVVAAQWRSLLKLGGVAAAVVVVGLAPFFLADRADFLYSFVTWRGTASIGGNSIWGVFACTSCTGIRGTLDALARRLDMYTVVLVVVIVTLFAARRFRVSAYDREAWAVLAIAALAVPMLSKTNWPYYYLEPFILLLVWEFTSMHDRVAGVWRWPVLTFGFLVVAATLSQYIGLRSVGTLDRISVGLLEFGTMLAFGVAIWMRMQAAKPGVVPGWARRAAEPALAGRSPAPAALPGQPAGWGPPTPPNPSRMPGGQRPAGGAGALWPADPGPAAPTSLLPSQNGTRARDAGRIPQNPSGSASAQPPTPWPGQAPTSWAGAFGQDAAPPGTSRGERPPPPRR